MGFGPTFISWIRLFYSLPQSSVLVNGYQHPYFDLTRGVRQGCPLSPLLYVLCAEVLAFNIRADPRIQGVPLPSAPNKSALISQYADDTSIIVTSDRSILAVFDTYKRYELASGAKLNRSKCKGLWLGPWRDRASPPVDIEWSSTKMKTLGAYIGPTNLDHDNWDNRVEAVENTLNSWRQRALSLQGKLTVINILVLSRLWYVGSLVPTPQWVVNQINSLVFSFFWKGKRDLVARKTVCQPKSHGGFGVVHIALKLSALRAMWVKRLVQSSHTWRFFLFDWFPDILNFLRHPSRAPSHLPDFYKSILGSWSAVGGGYSAQLDSLVFINADSVAVKISDLSCKSCYDTLLKNNRTDPHCVVHFEPEYGALYWPATWEQLHLFPLDRPVTDISWKVAHGVVYTAQRLTSFGYAIDTSCFCGAPMETLDHLFFHCPLAQSGLAFIEFHLHSAVPVAPSLTCRHILFGFDADELRAVPPAFVYLLNLLKYYIWRTRNDYRFRNVPPSAVDLIASIKSRFRFNMSVYARRFHSTRSIRRLVRLWGANGHFFRHNGDSLSFVNI